MRIYLPATLAELDTSTGLTPRVVHAVTAGLRAALPDEDEEGLEYAAQLLAADDSLDLLERMPPGRRRRVVVAADVPDDLVEALDEPDHAPSAIRLVAGVGWGDVACAHVDEQAAESDVDATLAGDDDAAERLAERDLLWYDSTELAALARGTAR
ncbi:hypothetical protein Q9R32_03850 [Actinotalea sp. AC32]|nr:hypothetical protein [Actinotalea sp. AC32]